MRLRNDSGYPLELRTYGRVVWPGEEIDTDELGHDMETHGVITGLVQVTEEPAKRSSSKTARTTTKDKSANEPADKETNQ